MKKIETESTKKLLTAISKINNIEELELFFDDICTIKEFQDMAMRFETAIALSEGKNYQQIVKEIGASSATISRVNRCLLYGDGGYKIAIEKIGKES